MNAVQFFIEQHQMVRAIIEQVVLSGLSNDQLRYRPVKTWTRSFAS